MLNWKVRFVTLVILAATIASLGGGYRWRPF
jgi:hypothetical protein